MKKIKYFAIIIILLLTGCTINYDVIINKDSSVDVDISASKLKSDINGSMSNFYNNYLSRFKNYYAINDVKLFKIKDETLRYGIEFNKSYTNINEFLNSIYGNSLYSSLFTYSDNDGIITIKNNSRIKIVEQFLYGLDEDPVLDNIKISIKVPFIVNKNNADYVDKNKNIFVWNFDKDSAYKNFILEFDSNKLFSTGVGAKKIISYIFVLIGFIIIIFLATKSFIIKSNKNNKV